MLPRRRIFDFAQKPILIGLLEVAQFLCDRRLTDRLLLVAADGRHLGHARYGQKSAPNLGGRDQEVGRTGLSLRTRVQGRPGMRGRDYVLHRVQPGEYRVELKAGETVLTRTSAILQDFWYDKTFQ